MIMLSYDPVDRTLDRVMKSSSKPRLYGPNWQGVKCEARTRRGTPCQRPSSKQNGRCKFHGGRSTGLRTEQGIACLAESKVTHGRTTKVVRAKAKRRAEIGRQVMRELREIETWAVDPVALAGGVES